MMERWECAGASRGQALATHAYAFAPTKREEPAAAPQRHDKEITCNAVRRAAAEEDGGYLNLPHGVVKGRSISLNRQISYRPAMRRLLLSSLLLAGCGARPVEGTCAPELPSIDAPTPIDCTFAGAGDDAPILVGMMGSTLFVLRANGDATSLFSFAQAPAFADYRLGEATIVSRGRWVAAILAHTTLDRTSTAFERVIVSLSGEVTHHDQPVTSQGDGPTDRHGVTITGDGRLFAFGYGYLGGGERVDVVMQTGALLGSRAPFMPLTDPDERGRVGIGGTHGQALNDPLMWLDACDAAAPSVYEQLSTRPAPNRIGPYLVYPSLAGPLVREGAGGLTTYPLPTELPGWPALFDVSPAGFAIAGSYSSSTFVPVNLLTGEARSIGLVIPSGLLRVFGSTAGLFSPVSGEIGVDSRGQVMIPFYDGTLSSMFITPDGVTFTAIGMPYSFLQGLQTVERGGSYLIFAPNPEPVTSPGVLTGPSLQLVRPEAGVAKLVAYKPSGTFFPKRYRMSHDGQCVSRLDSQPGKPGHIELWSAVAEGSTALDLPWLGEPGLNNPPSSFVGGDDVEPPVP